MRNDVASDADGDWRAAFPNHAASTGGLGPVFRPGLYSRSRARYTGSGTGPGDRALEAAALANWCSSMVARCILNGMKYGLMHYMYIHKRTARFEVSGPVLLAGSGCCSAGSASLI